MRCFKSTRGYVNRFCAERGRSRPRSTWYLVEYENGSYRRLPHAPRSYRNVKKVIFSVDDEGFVEKLLGLWIEKATLWGREWLIQRRARQVLDSLGARQDLCRDLHVPYQESHEVCNKLARYLMDAKEAHRREFDQKVLATAREAMTKTGEFWLLNMYGDSLENPPQE